MKKTLVALAVLGLSGAAMAQSSVTLGGLANIGIWKETGKSAALTGGPDGSDSRLFFKGTEDIGNGLKANFNFEMGFKPDTGVLDNASGDAAKASKLFQRQAWIGLSGGFGEVRLGRQYSLGFQGSIGNMPATNFDPQIGVGFGFNGMGSRLDDSIQYWSPVFSGFQARLGTQLKGDTTTAANELGLAYNMGNFGANLTVAKIKGTDGNHIGLNGSYNFGVAKVALGMVDEAGDGTDKGAFVRVTGNMGAFAPFVGYARNTEMKKNAWDLGTYYSLSKRTRLYGMVTKISNSVSVTKMAVGVTHAF